MLTLDGGLSGIARLVEASKADHVVLASTSCVFLADPAVLREKIQETTDHVVKLSVGRTPVEVYISRPAHLARLLASAAAHDTGRKGLRAALFDRALHDAIDLLVDVPGEILFQNDLMEYYTNNIWVVANCESTRFHAALSRLPDLADKGAESRVGEKGTIRNSWLACGVEVEGTVEDSILFPNVLVRRNALVSRAVVLNGNRIGSGSEIQSALILPYTAEVPRPLPNIGDNCSIGARTSTMKNSSYPAHIRNGLAVVGMNADIPNGFKAEAATYIAPGVSACRPSTAQGPPQGRQRPGQPPRGAEGRGKRFRGGDVSGLATAVKFFDRTQRFIITAHETPDGDALGSECAMLRALRSIGKDAVILNADPTPRKFHYLDADGIVGVVHGDADLPADIGEYSLLILDTNDVRNIGQVASLVLPRVREHFIIDHHEHDLDDVLGGNFIQKGASSTCEIVYELLREMNVHIDLPIAQALYTGIVYDTGCFIYPKTTALTFEIARDLVAIGVKPNAVYANVYESNSISALVLQSQVLTTLELSFSAITCRS